MTKSGLITQSSTKRHTAAAIAAAKARHGWSNSDVGDHLGCGEGTVRNRLDADCPHNQMTVHELLRSIVADGGVMANDILRNVRFRVDALDHDDGGCDRAKESSILKAALALSVALEDGSLSDKEIEANRLTLENAYKAIAALLGRRAAA